MGLVNSVSSRMINSTRWRRYTPRGAFKSLSVKLPDGKVEIPGLYKAVLSVADIYMISKLLNKHKVDFDALPLVYEGDIIVQAVNFQNPLITELPATRYRPMSP